MASYGGRQRCHRQRRATPTMMQIFSFPISSLRASAPSAGAVEGYWTEAVLLGGASTPYDRLDRKDRRGRPFGGLFRLLGLTKRWHTTPVNHVGAARFHTSPGMRAIFLSRSDARGRCTLCSRRCR